MSSTAGFSSPTQTVGGGGSGGAGDNNASIQYSLDPIAFRSVGEKKLADTILSQVGTWDEARRCFLTKEKLLQDLSKTFQGLNNLLRHAQNRLYQTEGKDVNAVYPKCPRILMKEHNVNNSQLSLEDPTKQNIDYRRQIAMRNAMLRERELEGNRGSGILDAKERSEWLGQLEGELLRVSTNRPNNNNNKQQLGGGSTATAAGSGIRLGKYNSNIVDASRGLPPKSLTPPVDSSSMSHVLSSPHVGGGGGGDDSVLPGTTTHTTIGMRRRSTDALPRIALEGRPSTSNNNNGGATANISSSSTSSSAARHSSLLMQLKKTKSAYQHAQTGNTIVASILALETNAPMKNAITRMFANPKQADAISQEEHDRREREFLEERSRTAAYQESLVKEEREAIERELAQLK